MSPQNIDQEVSLTIQDFTMRVVPTKAAVLFYNDRGGLSFVVERLALPDEAMSLALASAFVSVYVIGLERGFTNGRKAAQATMRSALGLNEE